MADEGRKREFRIDSSDAARPPAQIGDEPYHYAQGLKPKPRVIVSTEYQELNETVSRGKGVPPGKLILRVTTYDDGTSVDTTVGEDNALYQDHLRGVERSSEGSTSTRKHTLTKKPAAPKSKSKG